MRTLSLLLLLTVVSCSPPVGEQYMDITYKVYYPGETKEFNETYKVYMNGSCPQETSDKGTNYLRFYDGDRLYLIKSSSAPISLTGCKFRPLHQTTKK